METKLNSKGKRFFAQTLAAGLALAMSFTLNACGGDGGSGGGGDGGDEAPSSSSSGNGSPSSSSSVVGSPSSSSSGSVSSSSGTSSSSSEPPPKCGNVAYDPSEEFCDVRGEEKLYKYVEIDGQNWMAENLNFNAAGSRCYGDNTGGDSKGSCTDYGRLYDWSTAMGLEASCNFTSCSGQVNEKHRGICPTGWHIPSNADWDKLMRYVDGSSGTGSPYDSPTAGKYLKAKEGWNDNGNGEDTYGFSALPGGFGYSGDDFRNVGDSGFWWSASEGSSSNAYAGLMDYLGGYAYWGYDSKGRLYSVRCLQD